MSINRINESDSFKTYKRNFVISAVVGGGAGAAIRARKPAWLSKGEPSDAFVKQVSKELRNNMSPEDRVEADKINRFYRTAIDPEVNIEGLKPMLRDSRELSQAIMTNPGETLDEATERVFSNPNRNELREEVLGLQMKTVADKKANKNTATRLIADNFNPSEMKLVKSESTTDEMFAIVKKAASKVKTKAIVVAASVGALAGAAVYLFAADIPGSKK